MLRTDAVATRETLLSRLKDWSNQQSWREFFDLYQPLIFATALKAGLNEGEADDVVQETLLCVARTIGNFVYDPQWCRFRTWIGHLTRRRIADHFRKRSREKSLSLDELAGYLADPNTLELDAIWDDQWRQRLLETALRRIKSRIDPDQYQIFDFYVLRKMPLRKVAADLAVSAGQVYLAKHRILKLIKKEVELLEAQTN